MPKYLELNLKTPESVYRPDDDSYLAAELLEKELDRSADHLSVLDMGTGSGILGITAAVNPKVDLVMFADLNPAAVETSAKNLALNSSVICSKCLFVKTNLFSDIPLDSKFDLILFNAPYLPNEKDGSSLKLALDGGITGVELTSRFLEGAIKHLKDNGRILIVHSSLANERRLKAKISSLKLVELETVKRHIFFEDISATLLKKQ